MTRGVIQLAALANPGNESRPVRGSATRSSRYPAVDRADLGGPERLRDGGLKHVEARRSTGAPLITKHQEWRAVPRDVRKFEAFDGHRDDNYEDLGLHSSLCNAFFMPFQSNMFLQAAKANYFVLKHFLD